LEYDTRGFKAVEDEGNPPGKDQLLDTAFVELSVYCTCPGEHAEIIEYVKFATGAEPPPGQNCRQLADIYSPSMADLEAADQVLLVLTAGAIMVELPDGS